MNEYRVTRPSVYSDPSCVGFYDSLARQGYYVDAESAKQAAEKARIMYHGIIQGNEAIDVSLWKDSTGQSVRSNKIERFF